MGTPEQKFEEKENVEKQRLKRRSSILKTPKPRNPFEDIDFTETFTDLQVPKPIRRVSFASSNYIKPFVADPEKNTIWDTTYEEDVNHTNSTQSSQEHNVNSCTKFGSTFFESTSTKLVGNVTTYVQDMELTGIVSPSDKENIPVVQSIVDYAKKRSTVPIFHLPPNQNFNGNVTTLSSKNLEFTCENFNPFIEDKENVFVPECVEGRMNVSMVNLENHIDGEGNSSEEMQFTCQLSDLPKASIDMTLTCQLSEQSLAKSFVSKENDMTLTCQLPQQICKDLTKPVSYQQDYTSLTSLTKESNKQLQTHLSPSCQTENYPYLSKIVKDTSSVHQLPEQAKDSDMEISYQTDVSKCDAQLLKTDNDMTLSCQMSRQSFTTNQKPNQQVKPHLSKTDNDMSKTTLVEEKEQHLSKILRDASSTCQFPDQAKDSDMEISYQTDVSKCDAKLSKKGNDMTINCQMPQQCFTTNHELTEQLLSKTVSKDMSTIISAKENGPHLSKIASSECYFPEQAQKNTTKESYMEVSYQTNVSICPQMSKNGDDMTFMCQTDKSLTKERSQVPLKIESESGKDMTFGCFKEVHDSTNHKPNEHMTLTRQVPEQMSGIIVPKDNNSHLSNIVKNTSLCQFPEQVQKSLIYHKDLSKCGAQLTKSTNEMIFTDKSLITESSKIPQTVASQSSKDMTFDCQMFQQRLKETHNSTIQKPTEHVTLTRQVPEQMSGIIVPKDNNSHLSNIVKNTSSLCQFPKQAQKSLIIESDQTDISYCGAQLSQTDKSLINKSSKVLSKSNMDMTFGCLKEAHDSTNRKSNEQPYLSKTDTNMIFNRQVLEHLSEITLTKENDPCRSNIKNTSSVCQFPEQAHKSLTEENYQTEMSKTSNGITLLCETDKNPMTESKSGKDMTFGCQMSKQSFIGAGDSTNQKLNEDPHVSINVKDMTFKCQIPKQSLSKESYMEISYPEQKEDHPVEMACDVPQTNKTFTKCDKSKTTSLIPPQKTETGRVALIESTLDKENIPLPSQNIPSDDRSPIRLMQLKRLLNTTKSPSFISLGDWKTPTPIPSKGKKTNNSIEDSKQVLFQTTESDFNLTREKLKPPLPNVTTLKEDLTSSFHFSLPNMSSGVEDMIDDTQHFLQCSYSKSVSMTDNITVPNLSNFDRATPDTTIDVPRNNKLSNINDTYVLRNKKICLEGDTEDEDNSLGLIDDECMQLDDCEYLSNAVLVQNEPKVVPTVKETYFPDVKLKEYKIEIKRICLSDVVKNVDSQMKYITNYLENFEFGDMGVPEVFPLQEKLCEKTEDTIEEEVVSETIEEKIRRHQKSCRDCWRLQDVDQDLYTFSTLFGKLTFVARIRNVHTGRMESIQTDSNLSEKAKPLARYILKLFLRKLDHQHVSSAIGYDYDVITLLDYVQMIMLRLHSFQKEFTKLKNVTMDECYTVTYQILNVPLALSADIRINVDELENLNYDQDIKISTKIGTVNENEIKNFAKSCPRTLDFFTSFKEKIEEYLRVKEKRKMFV